MSYRSRALAIRYCHWTANESRRCWITSASYRDIVSLRHFRNSENCIRPVQSPAGRRLLGAERLRVPLRRFENRAIRVIWSIGCFSGRVAEWQTRWLQVPVSFGTWGFKSPFAHTERFYELRLKGREPNRVRGL